jgi:hypothetical protein
MKAIDRIAKCTGIALMWVLAVVVTSEGAVAQTWVGSTGTVDASSLATYEFKNGAAYVRSSLHTGTVILRYNVLPVGDLIVPLGSACCEGRALWVRFLDNGNDAQVRVNLKSYNVNTGQITTLITFDSNNYAPASTFQTALSSPTSLGPFFNFSFADGPFNGPSNQGGDSVYYIEAKLIRTRSGGSPALASVSIVRTLAP